MPIDVTRARAETPGCHAVIHLNNAGSSLAPKAVTDAMVGFLRREAMAGGYEIEASESEAIGRYRSGFAQLLNADADEIAFANNDSLAFSTAWWGLVHTGTLRPGSTVVVDRAAYVSHALAVLQAARYVDLRIVVAESDDAGVLDLDALRSTLASHDVSAVSLTQIGLHRGLVHPVAEAGTVIRGHSDAVFLLDACQALGQLPVDVRTIGCDVLTGTGRKFLRGPRGTGVLFVARHLIDRLDPPGIDGHSAAWNSTSTYDLLPTAQRMETFEVSQASKIGLGVAVDYALSWGIADIAERVGLLADRLRSSLAGAGYEVLDGPLGSSGIVTFRASGETASSIKERLQARSINTSVVRTPSARYDLEPLGRSEIVRASVHYYNTVDELDAVIDELGPAR